MDIHERARRLLEKAEPSVSGQSGHGALLSAAGVLIHGFDLMDHEAHSLLMEVFNPRCMPPWSDKDVRRKISEARKLGSSKPKDYLLSKNAQAYKKTTGASSYNAPSSQPERLKTRNEFDPAALSAAMLRGFSPDYHWLAERSPLDVRQISPAEYLNAILQPGEKNLIFYQYYSQGQYGFHAGTPSGRLYALGDTPGSPAKLANTIKNSGLEGAWYLANPVDGKWYKSDTSHSRRSGSAVTAYRYLLLESDAAPESEWLNLVCQLPLPITALYTSGGRSVHSLVRVDAKSKEEFDEIRAAITPLLSKLGADPGAISGVRLTRLPGVMREGKKNKDGKYEKFKQPQLQRLLFLNPSPTASPIKDLPRIREVCSL